MSSIEVTGKTVEEAITMAVMQLAVRRDNLNIEVIQEPEKAKFGLFGGKPAIIRATTKQGSTAISQPKEKTEQKIVSEIVENRRNESDSIQMEQARTFLNGLFEKMNINVEVDIQENESTMNIDLSGQNMGLLIGHRGETLDAIQYMISLIINKGNQTFTRVVLDTENYREKREKTLQKLALRLADKVVKTRRKVALEPMNPYERRIIHAALQDNKKVFTRSQGEEPYRKVVILYKR